MKNMIRTFAALLVLMCLIMVATSCQKDSTAPLDEAIAPAEISMKQPDPGLYTITKFTDSGDDETAQFNGYTFKFKVLGNFIATTNTGVVFNGSWSLNSAETMMTINISGNEALKDLDNDDWIVVAITNKRIKIKQDGPDIVVFQKL